MEGDNQATLPKSLVKVSNKLDDTIWYFIWNRYKKIWNSYANYNYEKIIHSHFRWKWDGKYSARY